ncbi:MAG TPA: hypothetical protein ENH33_08615, partial [Actinobacteria bacterium]|nr:hypothetical protein [Actinomycetota bacterium]
MLEHVVLFRLPPGQLAGLDGFISALKQFLGECGDIVESRVVGDLGLRAANDRAYHVMAVIRFEDAASFLDYVGSEAHQTFLRDVIR